MSRLCWMPQRSMFSTTCRRSPPAEMGSEFARELKYEDAKPSP